MATPRMEAAAQIAQFNRLQRRIRQTMHELGVLANHFSAHDLLGMSRLEHADQRQLERNCVCLEVALDETARWARTLVAQIDSHRSSEPAAEQIALLAIDQLIGEISLAH